MLAALVVGLVGGVLVLMTAGIAAAFMGHAVTRFALFMTMGYPVIVGSGTLLVPGSGGGIDGATGDSRAWLIPPRGYPGRGDRDDGLVASVRSGLPEPNAARPSRPLAGAPPTGFYVHFPFCLSLCPYCDFVVVAGSAARGPRNRVAELLEALLVELELRADMAWTGRAGGATAPLRSVYLGGGTPSLMAPAQVEPTADPYRSSAWHRLRRGGDAGGQPGASRTAVTWLAFGQQG